MIRVFSVSAADGSPNFIRKSTAGVACPRTFTTPRMYGGAAGTRVICETSSTSRTGKPDGKELVAEFERHV